MTIETDIEQFVLGAKDFQRLIDILADASYRVIGPTMRDGAIVYDDISATEDLPVNWSDEQQAGIYRLTERTDGTLFGYNVGPQAWKRFLHPAALLLWRAERSNGSIEMNPEENEPPRFAFLGVRSCDLHAIAIQDRVFMQGEYTDPTYAARRERAFIVAVNCGHAGGTCFCASMNTGPKAESGFDLALTEILENGDHYFVVETGTERGADVLNQLPHRMATDDEIDAAERVTVQTATQMGRTLDIEGLKDLLYQNYDHPQWDDVARRCLTCGNCTMVCPTCFCTTIEDVTDLAGEQAERWRRWDSCFTMDFSYLHGGAVRQSPRARYRQWMTHKLATWIDQFGMIGCVGCGRCITWCPVGIDITAEVRAIRESISTRKEEQT